MITVSREWKEQLGCINIPNRDKLVPEAFVKIEYEQNDPSAQTDATATANTEMSWSDTESITDPAIDYTVSYLDLELNNWILDGTAETFPTTSFEAGYVSQNLSGDDGTFITNPTITLTFSETQTKQVGGLRICWSSIFNEYATAFTVNVYDASNMLLNTASFTNNKVEANYDIIINNYKKIEIIITEWCLPYHRARIESVLVGMKLYFEKDMILSYKQFLNGDLFSFTLPDSGVTFEIDNVDGEWNPDNPSGFYSFFIEMQKTSVYYQFDLDGEGKKNSNWKLCGTYYMSEWNTPQNGISATFTARSLIDFMGKTFDPSSISGYTYGNSITLRQLATEALTQADLPTDANGDEKWDVSLIPTTNVVIPYRTITTSSTTTYEWDFNYTCAEVLQLVCNAGRNVIRLSVDGDIVADTVSEELTDYQIDQFVSFYNSEYDMSRKLQSVVVNDYNPVSYNLDGEIQEVKNSLVQSQSNANEVSIWIGNLLNKRKTISGEWRVDPRLEVYDLIKNENKYAINTVLVTGIEYNFSGVFKGSYEGRVIKTIPKADLEGNYYINDLYSNGEF